MTADWLAGLPDDIHGKLVGFGLTGPRASAVTLGAFLDRFIAGRPDVKESTRGSYDRARGSLLAYFDADRSLSSITPADAEAWRVWLKTAGNRRDNHRRDMAENTVRRRTGLARQFFAAAVRWKLIAENPFYGLTASVGGKRGAAVLRLPGDDRPGDRRRPPMRSGGSSSRWPGGAGCGALRRCWRCDGKTSTCPPAG